MSDDSQGQRRLSEHLQMTRIVLRPTGNPLPLAFMSLAVATVGFSSLQLGVVGTEEESVVALAVLVLTVPLQLFSSIVGFGARDPIAGTGMAMVSGVVGHDRGHDAHLGPRHVESRTGDAADHRGDGDPGA